LLRIPISLPPLVVLDLSWVFWLQSSIRKARSMMRSILSCKHKKCKKEEGKNGLFLHFKYSHENKELVQSDSNNSLNYFVQFIWSHFYRQKTMFSKTIWWLWCSFSVHIQTFHCLLEVSWSSLTCLAFVFCFVFGFQCFEVFSNAIFGCYISTIARIFALGSSYFALWVGVVGVRLGIFIGCLLQNCITKLECVLESQLKPIWLCFLTFDSCHLLCIYSFWNPTPMVWFFTQQIFT
jgi:hypothetical protein